METESKQNSKVKIVLLIILALTIISVTAFYFISNHINRQNVLSDLRRSYTFSIINPVLPPKPVTLPEPVLQPVHPTSIPVEKGISKEFSDLIDYYGNDDIVGYLRIEGTSIDYPVLQYTDNEFYLNHDEYKKPSSAGAIYLDYENDITREDRNNIIYGHNMNNDIMFHALRYYGDESFYEEHKEISFNTLYNEYIWEAFAFYNTNISFEYLTVLFEEEEDFLSLAAEMQERSMYESDIQITPKDRILTLSTCTNITEDTRYVLNCRLKSIDGVLVEEIHAKEAAYEQELTAYEDYLEKTQHYQEDFDIYHKEYDAYLKAVITN